MRLGILTKAVLGAGVALLAGCGEAANPAALSPGTPLASNAACTYVPNQVSIEGGLPSYAVGYLGTLHARVIDTGGCVITADRYEWSSSNPSVALVVETTPGYARIETKAAGSVQILVRASTQSGAKTGTLFTSVYVNTTQQFVIDPNPVATLYGYPVRFKGYETNGGSRYETPVASWSSSNPSIVTIDASGLATGVGVGTATITGTTSTGKSATATITINPDIAMSGPTYVYDAAATVTGQPVPGGSYHYTWKVDACTNTPGGCDFGGFVQVASGWNLPSIQVGVSRHDHWVDAVVELRHTAGGPIISQNTWMIRGAGEADTGSGCAPEVILC